MLEVEGDGAAPRTIMSVWAVRQSVGSLGRLS